MMARRLPHGRTFPPETLRALLGLCLLTALGCGSDPPAQPDPAGGGVRAGFARVDITPRGDPVKMAGYGVYFLDERQCRWSEGVHDPLFARSMALEDPARGSAAVLVALDLIGLMADDAGQIRTAVAAAAGIPAGSVVVCSSHTHHGPDTLGLYGTVLPPVSGREESVVAGLIQGAIRAGVAAWEAREPASFTASVGEERGLHENRVTGDPDRTIDHTLTLLAAYGGEGRLLGTILNWACHPTVMGEKSRLLSADFVGTYEQAMRETLPGVHLFVNGAIGASIEPVERFLDPDRWDEVDRFGRVLAEDARGLLAGAHPVEASLSRPVTRAVALPLENPFFRFALTSGLIPRDPPGPGEDGESLLTTFALGPVRFGTLPGEFVPDYSFRLRERMGGQAQIVIGLGQDWIGYAVSPDQYKNPAYAYERLLSPGRETAERVMDVYAEIYDNGTVER